jgi:hypothetical protein
MAVATHDSVLDGQGGARSILISSPWLPAMVLLAIFGPGQHVTERARAFFDLWRKSLKATAP